MNNKGFAITGILYTLFVMFLMILVSVLGAISYKKFVLEKTVSGEEESFSLVKVENVSSAYKERNAVYKGKYVFEANILNETETLRCVAYLDKGDYIPEKLPIDTDDRISFTLVPKACNDYSFSIDLGSSVENGIEGKKLSLKEVYKFKGSDQMKKNNIPRFIWVSSIFVILFIILYLVVTYKINYEYLTHRYLYFYECNSTLCVSQVEENDKLVYSKYDCGYDRCPEYLKQLGDTNYVVLLSDDKYLLYDYREKKIINDKYDDYNIFNNYYLIVESNKKKGIITLEGEVLVSPIYDEIGYSKNEELMGFNLNDIIVKSNDLYGIVSYKNGSVVKDLKYSALDVELLLEMIRTGNYEEG